MHLDREPPRASGATRWPLVALLIVAGILAAAQVGKAAIAAPLLQRDLGLSLSAVSWVVGAYAALGAVGGLAAGWGIARIGIRASLVGGMTIIAAASLAGALAADGTMLVAIRLIEGCGFLAVVVAIPTLLRDTTAPGDRDMVLSVWGAYMPAGSALMMFLAPALAPHGWQSLWLAHGAAALLCVPFLWVMLPHACGGRAGVPALAPLMRRHGPLLVAAAFALYTFQYTAISGLLPVYLVEQRGLSIGAAGSIAAFVVVANMLGNLSAGALLRLGVPLWAVVIAGFAGIGLAAFGIFSPSVPVAAVAVLTAAGLGLTGAIPASIFAAAPRLVREAALLALMFGLINQTSNLGQLLGPPALGSVVQQFGWGFAPVLIGIVALAGIATGVRLRHALRGAASQ